MHRNQFQSQVPQRKICRFFNSPQGCRLGEKCKFIHDSSGANQLLDRKFKSWSYMIPPGPLAIPLDSQRSQAFFSEAVKLVGQEAETMQKVIMRLASDGGLARINEIVENLEIGEEVSPDRRQQLFSRLVLPLFQTLAHPQVTSSLVAESHLDKIANFLFGSGGQRAIKLFHFVLKALNELAESTKTGALELCNLVNALKPTSIVFSKIVDLNGDAKIIDDFTFFLRDIRDLYEIASDDDNQEALEEIRKSLDKAAKRLGLGILLPLVDLSNPRQTDVMARPIFHVHQDGPGWLSKFGPRHDNDSEDIENIQILPTASEISSDRTEYLPPADLQKMHLFEMQGVLDRQFRLLREDTVGQIRDAVRVEIGETQLSGGSANHLQRDSTGIRTNVYREAILVDCEFHKSRGLDLKYQFSQPEHVRNMTSAERRGWWQASKRLLPGALVCLLDISNSPIFCVVSETGLEPNDVRTKRDESPSASSNIYGDGEFASITLSLAETDQANVHMVFKDFIGADGRGIERIIEFPGILLQSFKPTLQALKRRIKRSDTPFSELLAPPTGNVAPDQLHAVPPPAYSLQGSFEFDLSCLLHGEQGLRLSTRQRRDFDMSFLQQNSALDDAQAESLVKALSSKLALIQGPPGTGKSYTGVSIIKVLLANRTKVQLGPVLCVCHTNHALDQLLENLVRDGVEQIIRVGSRSKSALLEDLNLRHIARTSQRTKQEGYLLYQSHSNMKQHLEVLKAAITKFQEAEKPRNLRDYLILSGQGQHEHELFDDEFDEEGFQVVRGKSKTPIQRWLSSSFGGRAKAHSEPRPLSTLKYLPVFSLTWKERHILYRHWISDSRAMIKIQIDGAFREYLETKSELDKVYQEVDLRCLQEAHVIGVTTSGLARILDLLERVGSKILVCEEAGEVLEAHTLASLLPSIQHAILIGDHQQLRPQVQNYELSKENPRGKQFSLDVSLFERLVSPAKQNSTGLPFSTLETQRRMHPSISALIRPLYPKLQDAPNVDDYPEVSGMRKRLYWFDHEHQEETKNGKQAITTSHSNDFEVEMTAALVSHLIKQGAYKSQDVALLTPYLGQLRKLRRKLSQQYAIVLGDRDIAQMENDGTEAERLEYSLSEPSKATLSQTLRIATVDNFQGEEAKVVVISLVRCNDENKCGFLRTSNRINVLLSRAQHGMYIIGNSRTSTHVTMWSEVLSTLQESGNYGTELPLCCPRHPNTNISVKTPDDFATRAPEGGCDLRCDRRLKCGHACVNKCHSDLLHDSTRCIEPCPRQLKGCSSHPCPALCGDTCPTQCMVQIINVELPCGHSETLNCYEAQDPSTAKCRRLVEFKVEGCDHTIEVYCYQKKSSDLIRCTAKCDIVQNCGHPCQDVCANCRSTDEDGRLVVSHLRCRQACDRPYTTCNHRCQAPCHGQEPCGLCKSPCEVSCGHSACKKQCFEPCTPCAEEICTSACEHQRCRMPCAVPCDWVPCSKRCIKVLDCGHQCPSICGEVCPGTTFCQVCCSEEIKQTEADLVMLESYGSIDLDGDPCLFLKCGHIFTRSSLDGHFSMSEHYEMSEDGKILAVSNPSNPFSSEKHLKHCPHCRGSLRDVSRYGRIVRRALLDESTKRLLSWANREYLTLEREVGEIEESLRNSTSRVRGSLNLQGSRSAQLRTIANLPMFVKTNVEAIRLYRKLSKFLVKVKQEEQPFNRVLEMVQNVRRRRNVEAQHLPEDVTTVHMRHYLLATSLSLRYDLILLSATINAFRVGLNNDVSSTAESEYVVDTTGFRDDCLTLASKATETDRISVQAEAYILFAKYAALENWASQSLALTHEIRQQGLRYIKLARQLCASYPGQTKGMSKELEATEGMLNDRFYTSVSNDERLQILEAMSKEFSGTGHWYTCTNGHPFSIGECGMPMQEAQCPDCGAPIGGRNHQPVAGMGRAEDLEGLLEGLSLG